MRYLKPFVHLRRVQHRATQQMRASLFALLATVAPMAAQSGDPDFDAKVRAYLLDNPEVILEALQILNERQEAEATRSKIAAYPDLFTDARGLGMGADDAAIRVIEFFDYKCVPCKAVHPALEHAVTTHPALRIEMRHLPILSPGSERAARFALAVNEVAGPLAHSDIHDLLWAHTGPYNASVFSAMATQTGLDWPAIDAAMDSDAVTRRIAENRDIAVDLEIRGTPAFVSPHSIHVGGGDIAAIVDVWLSR